jgi:hypothetical protein
MLLALALLLVGSTANPRPPVTVGNRLLEAAPGRTLRYSVGDEVGVAEVNRDGLVGTEVNLRKLSGRLTGSVGTQPVMMKLEPSRVEGHIGDNPIELDVVRVAETLQITGVFGDKAVALEVGSDQIDGHVGPCSLRLTPEQGIYLGQIGCGGPPRAVRLTVPASLVAQPDDELAAMLVSLLAR